MPSPYKQHILCTWEIGGDLGHLTRLANITRKLEQRNYRVTLALKDLSRASGVLCDTRAALVQAPVWLPQIQLNRPIACMADSLLLLGYLEAEGLMGLYDGWKGLMNLARPDLILYDYSPTAMLANHFNSIPKIGLGTGFIDPVPGHPIADWRIEPQPDQLIARQEARLLETVNQVLKLKQQPPIQRLSDLYRLNHYVITTFPSLDIYNGLRTEAHYRPWNANAAHRQPVVFPEGDGPKIVAYLKPRYPHLDVLMRSLAQCKGRVFVACPGGQDHQFKPYASGRLHYSTKIVDLEQGIADADLFVGHGNMSSVTHTLQHGTPTIIVPIQMEQVLTGRRVEEAGAGKLITHISSIDELSKTIMASATSHDMKTKAAQFSQDNQHLLQEDLAETVADLCDSLLAR